MPLIAVGAGMNFGSGDDYTAWVLMAWMVSIVAYAAWSDGAYQQGFWNARAEMSSAMVLASTADEFAAAMDRAHQMTPHAWDPRYTLASIETLPVDHDEAGK